MHCIIQIQIADILQICLKGNWRSHASSSLRALKEVALCPKLVSMCPPIELNLVKKAPKRSVKVADTSESVKKRRVEDDVIDIDTLSKNNNVHIEQEGVRDGIKYCNTG